MMRAFSANGPSRARRDNGPTTSAGSSYARRGASSPARHVGSLAGCFRFFTLIQSGFGSFPFLRGNRGDC